MKRRRVRGGGGGELRREPGRLWVRGLDRRRVVEERLRVRAPYELVLERALAIRGWIDALAPFMRWPIALGVAGWIAFHLAGIEGIQIGEEPGLLRLFIVPPAALLAGWLCNLILKIMQHAVETPLAARIAFALRGWWTWRLKRRDPAALRVTVEHQARLVREPVQVLLEEQRAVLRTPRGAVRLLQPVRALVERAEEQGPELRLSLCNPGGRVVTLARPLSPDEAADAALTRLARHEGEAIALDRAQWQALVGALHPTLAAQPEGWTPAMEQALRRTLDVPA